MATATASVTTALLAAQRDGLLYYGGELPGGDLLAGQTQLRAQPMSHGDAARLVDDVRALDVLRQRGEIAGFCVTRASFSVQQHTGDTVAAPRRLLAAWLRGWRARYDCDGELAVLRARDTGADLEQVLREPDLDTQIRLRIRAAIEASGRTHRDIAAQLGRTPKTLSLHIELQGGSGIPIGAAIALGQVLGIDWRLDPGVPRLGESEPPGTTQPVEPSGWAGLRALFELRAAGLLVYLGPQTPQNALAAIALPVAVGQRVLEIVRDDVSAWCDGYTAAHQAPGW